MKRKRVENYLLSSAGKFLNNAAIERYCSIPKGKVNTFKNEKRKSVYFFDKEIQAMDNFFKEVMFYEY